MAVAIKAVSLNFRDLLVSQNTYFCPIPDGLPGCRPAAPKSVTCRGTAGWVG